MLEAHKLRLKKSEMLFEKELEAAKTFFALRKKIRPEYSHPDMDWDGQWKLWLNISQTQNLSSKTFA